MKASTAPAEEGRFPVSVRRAMSAAGATATCLPVKLDTQTWETAFFVQAAGPECKEDRRILSRARGALPVGIEADLIENEHAAVVALRLEVYTLEESPLVSEILLTPGGVSTHFDALKLLSRQPRLCWFFGDGDYRIVHSQQHGLSDTQHESFDDLLRDAVRHDSLIRCTARYDARAALAHVVEHYELREGVTRPEYRSGTASPRQGSKSRN